MDQILKSYLEHICGHENVFQNCPLSTKTSIRIGGDAKFFVHATSKEILVKLVSALDFIDEKFFIIGNGTNVLANDNGFNGVIIKPCFSEIVENGNFIYADSGANLAKVIFVARANDLTGMEWATGIPATVGGAVYMNAGAFGTEIKDIVVCVDVLEITKSNPDSESKIEIKTIEADKLKFGYRSSIFNKRKDWIILGAYFCLKRGNKDEIEQREHDIREKRKHHPTEPSCGSTFRRPRPEFYVGRAIEELGLKGFSIGGAQVSEKHAGFIINTGGATCKDVLDLAKHIRREIHKKYGIRLKLEYQLI
ncbi:MAG: UDP-N-acetylmuramate dehydrogenase [Firmicutes bacterium]|nr:UDP-N-acetylmuramate dehydrogenase [Bacillota bacterium]